VGFLFLWRNFFRYGGFEMADESFGEVSGSQRQHAAQETPRTKETKAQRAERLKRAKNPWDHLAELQAYARYGYKAFPDEWIGTYLRWWGVYPQGDGVGVVGGKDGMGRSVPYFMTRIRLTNGQVSAAQLKVIASVSEKYGRGIADITVRQNIQLHWIEAEALPDVLERLWRVGLTTQGSCGDDTRNITGCPLAGLDAEEICDASPLADRLTKMLVGNSAFYNLPRKFKVCVTGCRAWCSYPEINDVGLTAVERRLGSEREIGFSLRVGGGLSAEPYLARRLNAFVKWDQVAPVTRAIAEIFRDSEVLRQSRDRARLKFLFLDHGWTAESFLDELHSRLGFRLDEAVLEEKPRDIYRDHVGVHKQKQDEFYYVGAAVLRGRITAEQLREAAALSDRYGSGELRATNMQNIIVVNVSESDAPMLAVELSSAGLATAASPFWRGAVACTGTEFCKLAITETKDFTRWLVAELDERLPEFSQEFRLNVAGCPNACGQHWIADIGIEGKKVKQDGAMVDAYYFCVGGSVGEFAAIARPVGYRCAAREVPEAIERLLRSYQTVREPEENLRKFLARHTNTQIRELLAGAVAAEESRDGSPGPVPHGLDG
jgi:sulfite reductase (ferredoxin)